MAGSLGCTSYTSESGVPQVKEEIIRSWLMDPEKPFIVATSALGAGFDYPHVRAVCSVVNRAACPDALTGPFGYRSGWSGGEKVAGHLGVDFDRPDELTMNCWTVT